MEKLKTAEEQKQEEKILSATILHALDTKQNFEMFTYRIISREQYIQNQEKMTLLFLQSIGVKTLP